MPDSPLIARIVFVLGCVMVLLAQWLNLTDRPGGTNLAVLGLQLQLLYVLSLIPR